MSVETRGRRTGSVRVQCHVAPEMFDAGKLIEVDQPNAPIQQSRYGAGE